MRLRRGNYMILFAFLLPLMIGFLALAVDIGRLRVASIQAEGAADAAALAALVELRDGGSKGDAVSAATVAAGQIRMQRVITNTSGNEFVVEADYGDWDWDSASWRSRSDSVNSVTVNVEQVEPLGLLFGWVFNMGGGGSGDGWGVYGGGAYERGGEKDGAIKKVRAGRRAAMRPRDIVVVVDISRDMLEHHKDIQTELASFVETAGRFDIEKDQLATVVYAGAARTLQRFESLGDNRQALASMMYETDPCFIGDEAWYHYYRYYDSDYDRELAGDVPLPVTQAYQYNMVEASDAVGNIPRHPAAHFSYDDPRAQMYREMYRLDELSYTDIDPSWEPYNPSNWNLRELLEEEQCLAWFASWQAFMYCDPRRAPGCVPYEMYEGLACHEGGYWEGRSDRIKMDVKVPELECEYPTHLNFGGRAFSEDTENLSDFEYADHAYQQAGSNPGAGLQLAAALLEAEQPSRGEPTVVLVTSRGPTCGVNLPDNLVDNCEEEMQVDFDNAVADLERLGAVIHVLAVTADEDEIRYLEYLTEENRGQFYSSEEASGLVAGFDAVARDIKLQVVE